MAGISASSSSMAKTASGVLSLVASTSGWQLGSFEDLEIAVASGESLGDSRTAMRAEGRIVAGISCNDNQAQCFSRRCW
jgi:hypothetical protein